MSQNSDIPNKNVGNIYNSSNSSTNMDQADSSSPYMGNMKSKDIGALPNAGRLGGEMVRRMIKAQEEQLAEEYENNHLNE